MEALTRRLPLRAFLIVFCLCACSNSTAVIPVGPSETNARTIFVAENSWHSAIVLAKADIPPAVLPEVRDFPDAKLLQFGWGDEDYFPAPNPGVWLALKAAFWSSGSVIHVVGYHDSLREVFPGAELIEIKLSEQALQRLIKFISDTFSRPEPNVPAAAQPVPSSNGFFYPAHGKFSILHTCNTWVAEALKFAGIPLSPAGVITAGTLASRLRPVGTITRTQ